MSDQKHPRFDLKRYRAAHPLRPRRVQGEETDALTPMMKAIKAVHSVTSTGSTRPVLTPDTSVKMQPGLRSGPYVRNHSMRAVG